MARQTTTRTQKNTAAAKTNTASKAKTGNDSNSSNNKPGMDNGTSRTGNQQGSLLEKLFTDMLKDMYWAEQHLVPALKKMQQAATTRELQDAFEDHIYVTQKHAARLERVFEIMGQKPAAKKCEAMEGLTAEAETIMGETQDGTMTRDAALIIAAQKVEHYEIATYGSLVQLARTIGKEDAARILEKTLWDEEDTDRLLTDIAECDINPLADEEGTDITDEVEYEMEASAQATA